MRTAATIVLALAVSTCCLAGDIETACAVIEIDAAANTWVNGVAHDIEPSIVAGCVLGAPLVIAPDFSAPAGSFLDAVQLTASLGRPVKYLFPSSRRQYEEIFGLDPIRVCHAFSDRDAEPLPDSNAVGSDVSVRLVRESSPSGRHGAVVSVSASAESRFGIADEVAESSGAYRQSGGVYLVIEADDRRLRLRSQDFFDLPAPALIRHADGRIVRGAVDEVGSCLYPNMSGQ